MEIAFKRSEPFDFRGNAEVNVHFVYVYLICIGMTWLGFELHKWYFDKQPRWNIKCGFFSVVVGKHHKWVLLEDFLKSKSRILCVTLAALTRH